jgi:hypothetical protein
MWIAIYASSISYIMVILLSNKFVVMVDGPLGHGPRAIF